VRTEERLHRSARLLARARSPLQHGLLPARREGHLAELIGKLGIGQDLQLRTIFTTRDGDRIEEALYKNLDAPAKSVLDAYATG